jgi:hypothetical protein
MTPSQIQEAIPHLSVRERWLLMGTILRSLLWSTPTPPQSTDPTLKPNATYTILTPLNSHQAAHQLSQLLDSESTDE